MSSEVSKHYNTSLKENNAQVSTLWWYVLGVMGAFTVLAWISVFSLSPNYELHVTFFDVGQGDSIFIETYRGNQILIDGGPDATVLSKLGRELPFYDRTIDLMVLTHPHADHVSGLLEVLKRYRVGRVLITNVSHDTNVYKQFLDEIKKQNISITLAQAGQQIWLDDATVLSVLLPQEFLSGKTVKDVNESSVVTRLSFGSIDFILTGDAGIINERAMIAGGYTIDSEVLKVGHQGSRTSTDPGFLQAVSPDYAVISVGEDNRYGHPHQEVVDRLEASNLELLRTDKDGDVKFTSDGTILTRDK